MKKVKDYITRATKLTAISVAKLIAEKGFGPDDLLTEEESKKREILIDQTGADAMRTALFDIPFVLEIVGSEGRKHVHQYGEALPCLEGTLGKGELKLDMVNDVVEGSKAAKLNLPGAVSVIAISSHKGLMPTPLDFDYMDKLFGPPALAGKISIDKPFEENMAEVIEVFKVKPEEINLVVMDRDRNAHLINTAQKFGVNLIFVKAGDFLPSVLACISPKKHGVHLVMGIGGFEEGILSAAAAKALGAVGEGRPWSPDKKTNIKWTIDDLVPGKKEDCLVSITAITGNDRWFNLPGLSTLTVDSSGVKIIKND
jgi:fructose-1,6-bisphosphatase/sedoheptulose 1,7-bisphosphatase-like protein